MFSGLLVCSDCGSNLHFHFNPGNRDIQYFNCSNNNSRNRTCPTTHYIRVDYLEEIVLTDIRRLIAFTNRYKDEFIALIEQNNGVDSMNRRKAAEKEIEKLLKRNDDIDRLFTSMYEDKIKGSISEERFAKKTQGYEKEQANNEKRIFALSEQLKSDVKQVDTTKVFLDIVERTTDPEKLTEDIVRDFIDKIVVHHREVVNGVTTQKVEIFYNVIGKFEAPPIFDSEESQASA